MLGTRHTTWEFYPQEEFGHVQKDPGRRHFHSRALKMARRKKREENVRTVFHSLEFVMQLEIQYKRGISAIRKPL